MLALFTLTVGAPARELQMVPSWCNVYTCGFDMCAASDACTELSEGSSCASWCNSWTTGFSVCSGCYAPQPISYRYTTSVTMDVRSSIQTYTKIKSATCGYADLMGFVTSDPTILTEVPQFYSFFSPTTGMGYVTDTTMTSPGACEAYCKSESTCTMFYYQYEYTDSSTMASASATPRWMHKCQLLMPFSGTSCGSPYDDDANDYDEYAGRVSAAGSGY